MKKRDQNKKLSLNRETLRRIDTGDLSKAGGGCWSVNSDCPKICPGIPDEDGSGTC